MSNNFTPSIMHHTFSKVGCHCLTASCYSAILSIIGCIIFASSIHCKTQMKITVQKCNYLETNIWVILKIYSSTIVEHQVLDHVRTKPKPSAADINLVNQCILFSCYNFPILGKLYIIFKELFELILNHFKCHKIQPNQSR